MLVVVGGGVNFGLCDVVVVVVSVWFHVFVWFVCSLCCECVGWALDWRWEVCPPHEFFCELFHEVLEAVGVFAMVHGLLLCAVFVVVYPVFAVVLVSYLVFVSYPVFAVVLVLYSVFVVVLVLYPMFAAVVVVSYPSLYS